MKMFAFAAFLGGIAVLVHTPAVAQPVLRQPIPVHLCPVGESWQYGCVKWAPAKPGQLFGACIRNAWSCKRVGGPIQ